jgi:putative membrane protein insertion efficiency factor
VRFAAIGAIYVYRWTIGVFTGPCCKYYPSCSQYSIDAFRRHGFLRGVVLAGWRLLRCNPWSRGGYDPVDAQRLFR